MKNNIQIVIQFTSGNRLVGDFLTRETIKRNFLEQAHANISDEGLDGHIEGLIRMCSKIGDDLSQLAVRVDNREIYVNTNNVEYIDVRVDMPDLFERNFE